MSVGPRTWNVEMSKIEFLSLVLPAPRNVLGI